MKAKRVFAGMLTVALIAIASDQSMCRIPKIMQSGQDQAGSYSFFLSDAQELAYAAMSSGVRTDEGQQQRILIPGGQSIGISLSTEGVFVVEAADVILPNGTTVNPARDAGIASGDCILRINNKPIASMEMLTQAVTETNGVLNVEYARDGQRRTTTITPVRDESGIPRIGVWVRDSTAGIGTMTFMDPTTMRFGALGHAVTDIDTGKILPIETGEVYQAQIMEVKKGSRGDAGELHGVFTGKWNAVQSLTHNTASGVYGRLASLEPNPLYPQGLPIARPEELHTGPATILTTVDTQGIREFDCEILRVNPQPTQDARAMVLRIADQELLSVTGGIVQGMSGSPIIQDGKLVGAVTHVCVNL